MSTYKHLILFLDISLDFGGMKKKKKKKKPFDMDEMAENVPVTDNLNLFYLCVEFNMFIIRVCIGYDNSWKTAN